MDIARPTPVDNFGSTASKYPKFGSSHLHHRQPRCTTAEVSIDEDQRLTTSISLGSLPAEILSIILDLSGEASLIHSCRAVWRHFPSFVFTSRTLLLQAIVPLSEESTVGCLPETDGDVAAALVGLTIDRQNGLRCAVLSSHWLAMVHLQHIHKQLLHRRITQAYRLCGHKGPSRGQAQRIRVYLAKPSLLTTPDELVLRLRDAEGLLRQLIVKSSGVVVYKSGRVSPGSRLNLPVFELDGLVPDFLLRQPIKPAKIRAIRSLFHLEDALATNSYELARIPAPIGHARAADRNMRCNEDLLGEGILETICTDQQHTFILLMAIESRLKCQTKGVAIDQRFIECAVLCGRSRMLIQILKNCCFFSTQPALSEEYLLNLINRAKAECLPNWMATSRVLAMEVATSWKMREVQEKGCEATRVFHEWPPALNIRDPTSHLAQSWFIPRDNKHELDWEEATTGGATIRSTKWYGSAQGMLHGELAFQV